MTRPDILLPSSRALSYEFWAFAVCRTFSMILRESPVPFFDRGLGDRKAGGLVMEVDMSLPDEVKALFFSRKTQ
jgi:hypothetical protein